MSIPAEHLARFQDQEPSTETQQQPSPTPSSEQSAPDERDQKIAALQAQNEQLAQRTQRAEALALQALQAPKAPAAPAEPVKEPDWDNMSTKDIVQAVLGEVRKGQEETHRTLGVEIAKVKMEEQITRAMDRFPDFLNYQQDIVAITAEKNGTVTPVEAYLLAKARRGEDVPRLVPKAPTPGTGSTPRGSGSTKPPAPPANSREAATRAYRASFGKPGS